MFYTQVVGVPAPMVGLALTLALVLDAVLDPIVGYWSDNFHSKWGRRHPFMYASAIPVAVSFFLLWTPPKGWDHQALFWYLLTFAILTRDALTFFETPNAALGPELTKDYDERSALQSWRSFFGWVGVAMAAREHLSPAIEELAAPCLRYLLNTCQRKRRAERSGG